MIGDQRNDHIESWEILYSQVFKEIIPLPPFILFILLNSLLICYSMQPLKASVTLIVLFLNILQHSQIFSRSQWALLWRPIYEISFVLSHDLLWDIYSMRTVCFLHQENSRCSFLMCCKAYLNICTSARKDLSRLHCCKFNHVDIKSSLILSLNRRSRRNKENYFYWFSNSFLIKNNILSNKWYVK